MSPVWFCTASDSQAGGSAAGRVDGVCGGGCGESFRDHTEGLQQGKPSPVEMQLHIPAALLS